MSYIGNTSTTQAFTPAIDYFSGNGSTVAFTLSRPVASVAQVQVVVNNVPQSPSTAFTVSGSTITFTGAPSSGTNNIYVQYTSPITQVIAPGQGTVGTNQLVDGSITTEKIAAGAVVTVDIADNAVTTAKIANANVTVAKLSATGTPSSTTYLRGDGTWGTPAGGVTSITAGGGLTGGTITGSGTIAIDTTAGAIGSYAWLGVTSSSYQNNWNTTRAGSQLYAAGVIAYGYGAWPSGPTTGILYPAGQAISLSGTWRCLGYTYSSTSYACATVVGATLWIRIS